MTNPAASRFGTGSNEDRLRASGAPGAESWPAWSGWLAPGQPSTWGRRWASGLPTATAWCWTTSSGRAWQAESAEVLDAVQALIKDGNVDPAAIRGISRALREVTPFYCQDCGLNYCSRDWDTFVVFDEGFYDCTEGTCPNGHRHVLDD